MPGVKPSASSPGYSLVEVVCVMAMLATLSALTMPGVLANLDDARAAGAARYLTSRMQRARMEAVARSADVALRFVSGPDGYTYAMFVDGNANGVRTTDIQHGVDVPLMPAERLPSLFSGVDFGLLPGVPSVDPGGPPPGTDPIKLGSSNILTFSSAGTASPGSLYILGGTGAQYVIRISGETGRTRVLKFDPAARHWNPL
jgi:prepilin-type N-terminal cleavage/methylation domain-containing protein